LVVQLLRQLRKAAMPDCAALPLIDEQPGFVPALGRMLRNQFTRKVVVQLVDIHPTATVTLLAMVDPEAIARAQERIEQAAGARVQPAQVDAALERARDQIEALAATAAELQVGLPEAIQDGLKEHFRPSARHLAEVRGLLNQLIRRLEHVEGDLLAERHARVDDLALLVDLVASGWRAVNERLTAIEASLQSNGGAVVYRMEDRQAG
ncbi:MAG TPA: hypothetical protein VLE97_02120, partial [Gaiellaceae bacterium]|nr:hypothetical protein [Gaiellaceae bacterium]